jgi:hypothetical protein
LVEAVHQAVTGAWARASADGNAGIEELGNVELGGVGGDVAEDLVVGASEGRAHSEGSEEVRLAIADAARHAAGLEHGGEGVGTQHGGSWEFAWRGHGGRIAGDYTGRLRLTVGS